MSIDSGSPCYMDCRAVDFPIGQMKPLNQWTCTVETVGESTSFEKMEVCLSNRIMQIIV